MGMTKKDYELIAASIHRSGIIKDGNKIRQQGREAMRRLVASGIAGELYGADRRFDRDKFLEQCGVQEPRKPYKGTQFEED